jgi:hypothetical protein
MANRSKIDGKWVTNGSVMNRGGSRPLKSREEQQAIINERNKINLPIQSAQEFNAEDYYSYDKKTKVATFNKEGYEVERYDDGKIKRIYSKPKIYTKEYSRNGKDRRKDNSQYIEHEIKFDEKGNITEEIRRNDYESYNYSRGKRDLQKREVYDKEIKLYNSDGSLKSKKEFDDYSYKERKYDDGSKDTRKTYLKEDWNYSTLKKIEYNTPNERSYDYRESAIKKAQEKVSKSNSKSNLYEINVNGKKYQSPNRS